MRTEKNSRFLIAVTVLSVFGAMPIFAYAEPCMPCADLAAIDLGPDVTVISAELRSEITVNGTAGPVTVPVPLYCDVRGVIAPEQGFNVKLPKDDGGWNGRLYVIGNSVAGGAIEEEAMVPGLMQGYATAGTDTGHQGDMLDWSFGYNPPDNSNPNAAEKLADYCEESIHETTWVAKDLVNKYYCAAPEYSYYVGCSTGGRQGLMEAQVYPGDFDGILVGAPVHYLAEVQMRGVWEGLQMLGPGVIDFMKLPLLATAVMNRCDGIDGLVDGLIDNPLMCDFDARADLPACADDIDAMDCFTAAQRAAIYAIYDGPRNSLGELLTFGEAFGSESPDLTGVSGWLPWVVWPDGPLNGLSALIGIGAVQYIGFDPAPGPFYDFTAFSFDTDWSAVMDNLGSHCNADDPDLSAFRNLGGKMIHYDGWADPVTGPYQTVDYYRKVQATMGVDVTDDFYSLYMIPGMAHCGGGLGCYNTDALFGALVNWVENDVKPGVYPGARADGARTRPMCPYPEVARYLGEGSIDDAASFVCVEPVEATVNVVPDTIVLDATPRIVASIETPRRFRLCGYELVAVICEGALANTVRKVHSHSGRHRKGKNYLAVFNTEELVNIAAGDNVPFTVTAIFEKDGKRIALEGTDSVTVR